MHLKSAVIAMGFLLAAGHGCAAVRPAGGYHTTIPHTARGRDAARLANERGLGFAAQGDYEQAEGAFREALAADVTYAAAHNNLAIALTRAGRLHEAALELSFAVKLDPRDAAPRINLCRLFATAGLLEPAAAECRKALSLDEGNAEAMGCLAYVYAQMGKEPDKVETLLRVLARRAGDDQWKSWALARLSQQSGPTPE